MTVSIKGAAINEWRVEQAAMYGCCCCSPPSSPDTILAILFTAAYAGDVCLNFFVAFYEDGVLITDLRSIASMWAM